MDIWSKLLGGAGTSSNKRTDINSPQQRLIRFKRAHDQLQQIWRRNNASAKLAVTPDTVSQCLQNLLSDLRDEVQTPIPHLCARHVSTFHVHTTLAQVSATYNEDEIMRATLDIFKVLLDGEEGDFVKDKSFADALIGYASSLSTTSLDAALEAQILEVVFAIAAKLRLEPDILPAWFKPGSRAQSSFAASSDNDVLSSREDFPLFYLTVDYMHHEGRVGDFARTGLLYLIECAGHSAALEQWIIESDLATLMASGLGALYSQLSRKLVLSLDHDSAPAIIKFSEPSRYLPPNDAETASSMDFRSHLTTFLSHLVFWQDVLEHCTSAEVKKSLLDHFKFLFLQQLLYPSLIESSDIDGGSSVAVLTYLRCIIESINHPDLIHIVFQYLLAVPEAVPEDTRPSRPTAIARRRKSDSLLSTLAKGQEKPLPDLFNLTDLILTSLRSRNQQTVTATLRLLCVLFRNRHQYNFSVFRTQVSRVQRIKRSFAWHDHEMISLFSMMEDLAAFDALRDSYEAHLQDAQYGIEHHECSVVHLALPNSTQKSQLENIRLQSIGVNDSLLEALVAVLSGFLANDIEANLALTQSISTLALCGSLDLTPWLLTSSEMAKPHMEKAGSQNRSLGLDEAESIRDTTISNKPEAGVPQNVADRTMAGQFPAPEDLSPVLKALADLTLQIEILRREIENFDIFLSERKHVFQMGDDIDNAVTNDSPNSRRSEDSNSKASVRPKSVPQIGSISQRLLSQHSSVQSSRASSPRGRKPELLRPPPAPAGRLSHLHIPPSPVSTTSDSRAISPSPLRKAANSTTPPRRTSTPMGPPDALHQKIKVRSAFGRDAPRSAEMPGGSETSSLKSETIMLDRSGERQYAEVTLSHALTNVIILQEFMLELAAIIQVRASLFGEVAFDEKE